MTARIASRRPDADPPECPLWPRQRSGRIIGLEPTYSNRLTVEGLNDEGLAIWERFRHKW